MRTTEYQTHEVSRIFTLDPRVPLSYTTPTPRRQPEVTLYMAKPETRIEYPDELKLGEILSEGVHMTIPRKFLFGRQDESEYQPKKRRAIEVLLKEKGVEYLQQNPVITCAVPLLDGMQIVIVDGHHRSRYSGRFGIFEIPCLVYTPKQLVEAFNIKFPEEKYTETSLIAELNHDVSNAYASFRTLPPEKLSSVVHRAHTLDELPFKSMDNYK